MRALRRLSALLCPAVAAAQPATTKTIAPGVQMPYVNLGTGSGIRVDGNATSKETQARVTQATADWVAAGGVGIDTAWHYYDQGAIAAGIAASGVAREKVFLLTKTEGYGDDAVSQTKDCLQQLNISYLDVLMMHSPGSSSQNCDTLTKLSDFVANGQAKALGVSNWDTTKLDALAECTPKVPVPAVLANQHLSVGNYKKVKPLLDFAAKNGATVEAYSPLQKGAVLKVPAVVSAATAHNVSPAQVALKWIVQHGAVFATAVWRDDYIKEDLDLWSFTLSDAEMAALDAA